MFSSEFVWCDLSTFDLKKANAFYESVFGWTQQANDNAGEDDYTFFNAGARATTGIFTMPKFLQKIGMPSFWMSYVHVAELSASLDLAVKLGAKVEVEPTAFDSSSRFALVRDPCGAGFTLYEGPPLKGRDNNGVPGRMSWNELHVPSIELVGPFYSSLFGWEITQDPASEKRHIIQSPTGKQVGSILELRESIKGPKNYWAVYFSVDDMDSTIQAIVSNNGEIVVHPAVVNEQFALAVDDQGAAFCLTSA